MPWDVAHTLDPGRRLAYVIFFGELDGGEWDWDSRTWKPPRT